MNNRILFEKRIKIHDEKEEQILDIIRPYTTRRHLPDRWVSFNDKICAFDCKTACFLEVKSYNEYMRVIKDDGIPVFIVYHDYGKLLANWMQRLKFSGPYPPSVKSTSGDYYYKISGGIPLDVFLEEAGNL